MYSKTESLESVSQLWADNLKLISAEEDINSLIDTVYLAGEECYSSFFSEFFEKDHFYIVHHFPEDANLQIEQAKKQSLTQKWKESKIDQAIMDNAEDKHDLMCIYGEFSDTDTIEYASGKGFSINILCGPKLLRNNYKNEIKKLMKINKNDIRIELLDERPEEHAIFIGNRYLLIEQKHKVGEFYKIAYAFDKVSEENRALFISKFNQLKSNGKTATEDIIDNMDCYERD